MSKRKKHDFQWLKETIELKEDHNWKSTTPNHRIFVAGGGALRFDVPQDWFFEPNNESFQFFNAAPPKDDCRLEASYNLLPPGNWQEFPLVPLLKKVVRDDPRNWLEQGEIMRHNRQTARIVWTQIKFIDSQENREAYSRICIGLGSGVQCLISFDYWAEHSDRFTPVWDVVMESLTLGLYIRDPRTGFALPD